MYSNIIASSYPSPSSFSSSFKFSRGLFLGRTVLCFSWSLLHFSDFHIYLIILFHAYSKANLALKAQNMLNVHIKLSWQESSLNLFVYKSANSLPCNIVESFVSSMATFGRIFTPNRPIPLMPPCFRWFTCV